MIRDNNWYNLMSQGCWPLDEASTLLDDSGNRYVNGLLADLSLRFDSRLGRFAYVASLFVSADAVALVINAEDGTTLAAVTVKRDELLLHTAVPLTSIHESASGSVVFGRAIADFTTKKLHLKFSSAAQSRLCPKAARGVSTGLLSSAAKLSAASGLSGDVSLTSFGDIKITPDTLLIDGKLRKALVFDLYDSSRTSPVSVLEKYAGDCDKRPESGNRGEAQPITVINNVFPDCCGRIFLEIRGCSEISVVNNDTRGFILDCFASLSDACLTPEHLPDAAGRLPNEYPDECNNDYTDFTAKKVVDITRSASGKYVIRLDESVGVSLAPGAVVRVLGTSIPELNGDLIVDSSVISSSNLIIIDAIWTEDSFDGELYIVTTSPDTSGGGGGGGDGGSEPDPSDDPISGLPWRFSFGNPSRVNWEITFGGFFDWGGRVGFNKLAGVVQSITPDTASVTASVLDVYFHKLEAGDVIHVFGSEVPSYNTRGVISEVEPSSGLAIANIPWTADSIRGVWLMECSPEVNDGGSAIAGIVSITNEGGKCVLLLAQTHALLPGDTVVLFRSSVSAYNTTHTVTSTLFGASGNVVKTDVNYTSNATGGICVTVKSRGAGKITGVTQGADGYCRFATDTPHGLQVGDQIVIFGNDDSLYRYDNQSSVTGVDSPTSFTGSIAYEEDSSTPTGWFFIAKYLTTQIVYQSSPRSDSVVLWKHAIQDSDEWRCWNIRVTTVFSPRTPQSSPVTKFNGGIVLNYTPEQLTSTGSSRKYWFVELAKEGSSLIRVWRVDVIVAVSGMAPTRSYTLIKAFVLPEHITLDNRYELSVLVTKDVTDAEFVIALKGFDDGINYSTSLTVADYTPSNGRVGLGASQAESDFETFLVEDYDA